MKKILSIATTMLICTSVTACNKETNIDTDSKRFVTISTQCASENRFLIIEDRDTSVCYLIFQDGYRGGITPLIDKDGKPVLYNK